MQWHLQKKTTLFESSPFALEKLDLANSSTGQALSHPYYRMRAPDWVNIVPITTTGEIILIRQPRAGNLEVTLEIPGGVVDGHENSPEGAALRELEEETGYAASGATSLGSVNPNPALMTNTLHMFVATRVSLAEERRHFPDENEEIEIVLVSPQQLDDLLRRGGIHSALAALTLYKARNLWNPQG